MRPRIRVTREEWEDLQAQLSLHKLRAENAEKRVSLLQEEREALQAKVIPLQERIATLLKLLPTPESWKEGRHG